MQIRPELHQDHESIRQITTEAFAQVEYASQTEAAIIDALRQAKALTLSLVAVQNGQVVGHIAFSPVQIDGQDLSWYGLGPVSVHPDHQNQGIGQALIHEGLARLSQSGAQGCLLLGDPAYYRRFGFQNTPSLTYEEAPPEYFLQLTLQGTTPTGKVTYHPAFSTQ